MAKLLKADIPMHLTQNGWAIADILSALAFLWSAHIFRKKLSYKNPTLCNNGLLPEELKGIRQKWHLASIFFGVCLSVSHHACYHFVLVEFRWSNIRHLGVGKRRERMALQLVQKSSFPPFLLSPRENGRFVADTGNFYDGIHLYVCAYVWVFVGVCVCVCYAFWIVIF